MAKKKMSPNSLKNLEKSNLAKLPSEKRKEIARMGANAANEARRENKHITELAKRMVAELTKGIDGKEKTVKEAMLQAQIVKSLDGDINSFSLILKLLGEMPSDKVEALNTNIDITDQSIIDKVAEKIKEI